MSKLSTILHDANLRLCRIRMWSNYHGYGFELKSSSKPPHVVRLVESASPAVAGGLEISDVILSINNEDVSLSDYDEVIDIINSLRRKNLFLELLVIEKSLYRSLKRKNIIFDTKYARIIETPKIMPIEYQNYFKYQPRICEIYLNKSNKIFGFDLFDNENEIGTYIKRIHANSPAIQSCLRENDRIIEINDEYVDEKTGKSIHKRLNKAQSKGYVKLYVMDNETYQYYQENDLTLLSKHYQNNSSRFISSLLSEEDIRLCTIIRADSTDILGLTLNYHREEQFHTLNISSGRNNGPSNAKLAGIQQGDYLIEVNGNNIEKLDHEQVKQRLLSKKYPDEIQILVTNFLTYNYYKRQNKLIHHDLPNVKIMSRNISQECLSYEEYEFNDEDDEYYQDSEEDVSYSSEVQSYGRIFVRKKNYLMNKNFKPSINICQGDLKTQQTDVIVVCSSSQYLFDDICNSSGSSVLDAYNAAIKKASKGQIISVKADGEILSKQIYFLRWTANSDTTILKKSIEKFVSDAIEKAAQENYQTIAFPAIGCGRIGCSINFVAKTMIEEADRQLFKHSISVSFVIQSDRMDIFDDFYKQIRLIQSQQSAGGIEAISALIGKGTIEVEQGDITKQKVDVIIGSSSSDMLRKAIITAAGYDVQIAYNNECRKNPNSILISTPPGALPCKRIFFIKWEPSADEEKLQLSLVDLIWIVAQNMSSYNFTSVAFPAIGCGQHGYSVYTVAKTLVGEIRTQIIKRDVSWQVRFVIQSDQSNIYDEFCKQVLTIQDDFEESLVNQIPSTWEKSIEDKIRFVLSTTSEEYQSIISNFDQAMKGNYTRIIRIERIQNKSWYMQYMVHSRSFKKRLNMDTEKRLYHGCPEGAANSIIQECFNRSFAGVNGTVYGKGVYFSSNAAYSHGYTSKNANGERCMFVARVLIGKTTRGDSSMKTRPPGFDSTTDENHIFVTYHDAQAFAEYLITYK